jgi:hypothetical protein
MRLVHAKAINLAVRLTPPVLFDYAMTVIGRVSVESGQFRGLDYQGVTTQHRALPLHRGRFAQLYEAHAPLDPHAGEATRYRLYNICTFAKQCTDVPGDFLFCGISYGVAARVVYDYVDIAEKHMHLIDGFTGLAGDGKVSPYYNTSPGYVQRQYPNDAPVTVHVGFVPQAVPAFPCGLAFAHFNTGNLEAELATLPAVFAEMNSGGRIVLDNYGTGPGRFEGYDPVFALLGAEPLWLPSGQAVLFKP